LVGCFATLGSIARMTVDSTLSASFDGPVPGVPGALVCEVAKLPEHLDGAASIGPWTEVAPGAVLFSVPKIARYLVRDGATIEVEPAPGADRGAIALFLAGSARGALIHQRGELPLTAATMIAPNWRCVAICSPSAVGKSTLAAELSRRGWLLVADDITRVSWNGSMAVAWPSHNALKLWRDACDSMNLDCSKLARVREGLEKFFVPAAAATTPASLSLLVRLRISPGAGVVHVPASQNSDLLHESTFRPRMIDPLGRRADNTRIVSQISGVCRAIVLNGARECPIAEVADRLAEAVA